MHHNGMRDAFRPGLLQNGLGTIALTNQLVPFDRDPLAGIMRTVHSQPFLFAPAVIEGGCGEFVCHGYDQVLLFREWERFEWAEHAGLIDDFQLLGHCPIVPCAGFGGAAYGATRG